MLISAETQHLNTRILWLSLEACTLEKATGYEYPGAAQISVS